MNSNKNPVKTRNTLAFLIGAVGLYWFAGAINDSTKDAVLFPGVADVVDFFKIAARFMACNFLAICVGLPIAWPLLDKYNRPAESSDDPTLCPAQYEDFKSGFRAMTKAARAKILVNVILVEAIVAALCSR